MNFRQLRIGTRLAVGFGVILISLILILIAGSVLSAKNRQAMMKGIELSHNKTALAANMKSSMLEGGLAIRNIGMQTDLGEIDKQKIVIKNQRTKFNEAHDKLLALGLNDDEKKSLIPLQALISRLMLRPKKHSKCCYRLTAKKQLN